MHAPARQLPEGEQRAGVPLAVARAFGLDLSISFRFPGRPRPPVWMTAGTARPTRVGLASRRALLGSFAAGERLWEVRRPDGRRYASLDASADGAGDLLFVVEGFGVFELRDGGTVITCAPVRGAAWRWQRYLLGQVLPLASVLQGLEVFHTSVVRLDGLGVAVTGPSGGGKSSIAAALLARGAELVTDDVMAVDPARGSASTALLVEPGWALMSIRHDAAARLGPIGQVGPVIGRDDEATRVHVPVVADAVPLAALYVLDRAPGAGPLVETTVPVDPRVLLASSYNFVIRSPERLVRHLDACSRIATTAVVARATVRPGAEPSDMAAAIEQHLATVVG